MLVGTAIAFTVKQKVIPSVSFIKNNISYNREEATQGAVSQPSPQVESSMPASPTLSPTPSPTPIPKPSVSPPVTSNSSSATSGGNYTVLTFGIGSTVVTDTAAEDDCDNNCPVKSLAQFIADNGGRAGMNGTYFCPPDYAWCSGKVNTFDFPVWNNRKKKWMEADKLFWNGRGMMVFRPGSAQFFPNAAAAGAPSDITGGILNYPSLLAGGKLILDEGSLAENMKTKGTRSGIGFGGGKIFLVVARRANMKDLAGIFLSLGATDAMNLDGGGSVALYDGGYRAGPGRSLPNAIIIK